MSNQTNATNTLAHTKWNCKYHIVFAPKYRRKVFFNEKRADMREILKTLCDWKGVDNYVNIIFHKNVKIIFHSLYDYISHD